MSTEQQPTPPIENGDTDMHADAALETELTVPATDATDTEGEPLPVPAATPNGGALEDEELEDEPFAQLASSAADDDYDLLGSEVDIDAALAAVATLSDVAAEREAGEDALAQRPVARTPASLPSNPVRLKRGSLASLIPAMILIGSGVLLTLATTSGQTIPVEWIAFGALAAAALLLLGYWLSARRWAPGAFFFALLLILSAAAMYAITIPNGIGVTGAPLLIVATGAALMLTAVMTKPPLRRAILPGILLVLAGLAALALTMGMLDSGLLTVAAQYAWVLPIVLVVLWLLPVIFRRRD